jgi:HlyD family secretion protein
MKYLKYLFIIGIIISALIFTINFFVSTNKKSVIDFKTEKIFTTTIENNIVVTGKIIPKEEVELKPQISGIIDKIFVEEGDRVKAGDIIAKIRVVPNEQNLNASKGRVKKFRISLETTEKEFLRNKDLFQKGIISDYKQTF